MKKKICDDGFNTPFTVWYNSWMELYYWHYKLPELFLALHTPYVAIRIQFPPKKYWANWTEVFQIQLHITHEFWKKIFGFDFQITVLDLNISLEILNKMEDFPSVWVKEMEGNEK